MGEPQPGHDRAPTEAPTDAPTVPTRRVSGDMPSFSTTSTVKLFGSAAFFRLWLAQVASSTGDWIGFVAITAIAARVGGSSPEAAIGLVLSARLIPGFFLAPLAGVLVDRWNRKRVMVVCDIGRGVVFATLPMVDTVAGLVFASLLLEVFTMLWQPAKEATVPNLVRTEYLPTANSLSLAAAYGPFPIASALFAALAGVAKWVGSHDVLDVDQETLAVYFDVLTFFLSAALIATLHVPVRRDTPRANAPRNRTLHDLREAFSFIRRSPLVRSVMLGIGTGLIGGGMLVPLGPRFVSAVLGGGSAGFGLLLTALGTGVAFAIVTLSVLQRKVQTEQLFVVAVLGSGLCILSGASMSSLTPALVLVALLGVCAGAVYVLGFTILQVQVDDELRGRIFATFTTLGRFSLILAFTIAPFLASALDGMSSALFDRHVELFGFGIALPGVRLTLWLGGVIILFAGAVAMLALRDRSSRSEPSAPISSE